MTLGKSSSAGSESPVPFDAALLTAEECWTKDMQALILLICASNVDICDSQQSKTNIQMHQNYNFNRHHLNLIHHAHTFLTIVSFGFSTARPPGGSLGAPVTNWQKARCCSGVNSPKISSNYMTKDTIRTM